MSAPQNVVAQSCELPPRLSRLSAFLLTIPDTPGPISVRSAESLSAQLADLDDQTLIELLRKHGVQSLAVTLADIVAMADRIAHTAEVTNPRKLKRLLYDLNQQAIIACSDSNGRIFQDIQDEREGGSLFSEDVDWEAIEQVLGDSQTLTMGLMLVLIASVIAVLYLIDAGYRLAMALMYNRKACRIPAELRMGTDMVEVTITTLGRGGCRVSPDEPMTFDNHLAKMRSGVAVFDIDGIMIEAHISAIYKDVSDFRFAYRIALKTQKDLLALSTISPFYVKTNSKKPKDKPKDENESMA